jgi:hypothetical protein
MALVLVVCVMALAAVLSYALLATSSIQATASTNGAAAAVAEAQAEAGVKLAMYYLLNPQYAPGLAVSNSVAYWPGSGDAAVTFNTTATPPAQMPGSVVVTVTPPTNQQTSTYTVVATGSSAGAGIGGGVITRTITAQVELTYQIQQAVGLNSLALGTLGTGLTITGSPYAIRASGTLTLNAGSNITGAISAANVNQGLGVLNGTIYSAPASPPAPSTTTLNHYATYLYQGNTYSAVALSSGTLTQATLPAFNVTQNPLNVFYFDGDITLAGPINFSGTLIAINGNLIVQSSGSSITAMSTMPALVIDKSLEVLNSNQSLTVNGAVYAAAGIASGGGTNTGSQLTINGGLLVNTGLVTPPSGTTLNVTYNSALAFAPALSSVPNAVQLVSWSQ